MKTIGEAIGNLEDLGSAAAPSRARTCVRACAPSRARAVSINLLKYITYYTYLPYLKINLLTYSYLTVRGKVRGKGGREGVR